MNKSIEAIEQQIRASASLTDRLRQARQRIAAMCSQKRGPRMSIPAQFDDDDLFISTTLSDAIAEINRLTDRVANLERVIESHKNTW